jgi:predicted metal-dependent hydrolase
MGNSDTKSAFKERVGHWAGKLDVDVVWLAVRPMRNKWASCSTSGRLNFNADLLDLKTELWDYVIVHELLHFAIPNHGKLWKSLMRAHLGEYEAYEAELKTIAFTTDANP